jgi:hypothetical protein
MTACAPLRAALTYPWMAADAHETGQAPAAAADGSKGQRAVTHGRLFSVPDTSLAIPPSTVQHQRIYPDLRQPLHNSIVLSSDARRPKLPLDICDKRRRLAHPGRE